MNYFKILSLFIALALGHSFYAQSDGCTFATSLPVTANCSSPTAGTTLGATQTIPGCVGNADDDVWYQFTATSTTHNITVDGATGFDAVVQLFSGPCSALVSLGCQDQTFDGGVETIFASGLTIGAVYRIRVYHYFAGSGSGNFTICVTPGASAPANDECVNATLLSVNSTCTYTSSTSLGATLSQPGCAGNADDDVWFSFVATNSVQTITVDPSSSMDPVVQLFEGSCGALNSLYCEDSGFTNGNEVINAIGLTPGNTYFIRVYDYYTGTGGAPFQICLEGTPTATPTNDEPCNAIALPPVTSACDYLNFTTTGATASMGAPTPFSCVGGSGAAIGGFSASSADVWFTITVPASGNIFITPQPSFGINDGVMALYSGTCSSLTQIICSDDHNYPGATNDFKPYIAQTGLTPGSTVYLRYWGFGSSSGDFGICVSDPTNDDCANALYICDINGYSASTSAAYTEDRPGTGAGQMYGNGETTGGAFLGNTNTVHSGGPFGFPNGSSPSGFYNVAIDNNSWITFTASATTATLNVAIYDCWVGSFPSGGIQMQVFSGTNCDNFVPVSNFEESSTGFTITASGLTVGQDYYLMVDGYAGDICNYTITADSGVQFPEIEASVNPICQGEPTTLTAPAGATSYLWSPGGATTPSIIVNPSTTTTYTCVVEGVCGYKQTLSETISVNQLPTINNSLSQTICSGTVFNQTLTADLTSNYEWSATPNGNVTGETTTTQTSSTINNTLTLTSATAQVVNYNITPTAISSGCEGPVQTIAVTVNPLPTANAGSDFTKTCVTNPTGAGIGMTAVGGVSYSWSPSTGLSSGTVANPTANPTSTTTYTLTATNNSTSCFASDNVTVTVNTTPPTVEAGNNFTKTCVTNPTGASIGMTAIAGNTYSWNPTTGLSSGTAANPTTNPSTTTSYTLTATNTANGCTASDNVTVTVNLTVPTANAGSDFTKTCVSNTSGATIGMTAVAGNTYSWTPTTGLSSASVANPTANPTTTYTYTLTATNTASGCTANDNVTVTVDNTNLPTANAGSDFTKTCVSNTSGAAIGMTSVGGVSYSWTPTAGLSSGTSSNPTANPSSTTSYTLTATNNSNGCTASDNVLVTVNTTNPNISVGSTQTITCSNTSVNVSGNSTTTGAQYSWTGPSITAGANTNSATVNATGTYNLIVTNPTNGCTSNDNVLVNINNTVPNANAGGDQTLTCSTTSLSLNGSSSTAGAQYSWTGPGIISGGNTASPSVNGAGIYTLTVTDPANGCQATDDVEVIADANIPNANAGSGTTLTCSVTSFQLNGSSTTSGVNFSWAGPGIVSGGNTATPTVNAPGNYTLTIFNPANGCSNTASVSISQDITDPTVNISPSATTVDCNNTSVNLDGSASSQGTNFTYSWSTVGGNFTGTQNTDQTSVDAGGDYILTITNNDNGCVNNATVSIGFDQTLPTANAGADINFTCAVTSVVLDGSNSSGAGITYSWTGQSILNGANTTSPEVDAAGTYTLTVTGSNGCEDTDIVEVVPDANAPVADAGISQTLDCNTTSLQLDGSNSDSGTNITYSWSTIDGNIVSGANSINPSIDLDGTYTLTVTNTDNSCTSQSNVIINIDTISPIADVSATVSSVINCTSNLVTTLDGSNSTGTGLTFSWSTSNGNINSQNGANAIVSSAGDYLLTVEGSNGCQDSQSIEVTIDTISPIITVAGIDTLNCNISQTTIDASASTDIGGSYAWTTSNGSIVSGDNTNALTVGSDGDYTLTITNSNGCEITASFTVISAPNPIADFTPSTTNGQGPLTVDYTNNSSGNNLVYDWNFGDGNSATDFEPSNTFEEYETFTTTLIVTDEFGCTDTASVSIIVNGLFPISIPDGFSPNGDNTNDNFVIENIDKYPNNYFTVFNRWGNIVYEQAGYLNTWNGTSMAKIKLGGEDLPTGTYFYILDLGEDFEEMERIYKGFIYLNR